MRLLFSDSYGSVDVTSNDTDIDGDYLTVTSATGAAHGTLSWSGGTISYTPYPDYNGSDSFTYEISDGNGGTATATVSVTVNAVNDNPIAVDDVLVTDEDTSYTIDVTANDSDPDGDILTVTGATGGRVTWSGGSITYTPDANFYGQDSFTYEVSDGNGGTASATVWVTVLSVNDEPYAQDDSGVGDEGQSVSISVLGNDGDEADGDPVSISSVSNGAYGSVYDAGNGQLIYTAYDADWSGTDSFTYTVSDGRGGYATATVNVTVNPVNDDPVAQDDSFDMDEGTSFDIDVTANDSDIDGDTLVVTGASSGWVTWSGGVITYTPDAEWTGTDSFTYTISDGHGGTSTATVYVTVHEIW